MADTPVFSGLFERAHLLRVDGSTLSLPITDSVDLLQRPYELDPFTYVAEIDGTYYPGVIEMKCDLRHEDGSTSRLDMIPSPDDREREIALFRDPKSRAIRAETRARMRKAAGLG